jgi:type I restriction enzyme S subunit
MSSELRHRWTQAGGTIPNSWKIVTLESLLKDSKSIAVGVMYPGPDTIGGIPLIKVGDIKGGQIPQKPTYCISQETNNEHKRTQLVGDEMLITLVGNPGECVVVTPAMAGWNPARAIAVIRLSDPELRVYLKTVLESAAGKHLIDAVLNTTVQKTLNLKDVRQLPIPMPPYESIRSISAFSEALSNRINLLRETNATLEAIAQALFKSWFVDFDPVHANAGTQAPSLPPEIQALFPATFTDSPQGPIPEGWKSSILGDVCKNNGGFIQTGPFGSQLHAEDYVSIGTPVVMPKDIVNRRVEPISTAKISESDVARLTKHQLKLGDIVFSRRGNVEKHALIGYSESGWICGTGCLLVRPGMKCLSPSFISRALDLPITREWLVRHAVGATMPNLNIGILASVPVIQPYPDVLVEFDKLVGEIDIGISHNFDKIRTLTILRDSLLPRLISGQLRLPEAKQAIATITD